LLDYPQRYSNHERACDHVAEGLVTGDVLTAGFDRVVEGKVGHEE